MNIPERQNIEVYLNGECKNFKFIGSYKSDYGPMGVEHINLIFPIFINEIESWNEIKEDLIVERMGFRKNVELSLHVFNRDAINKNLFSNIANGIVLEGFLEI